MKVRDVRNVKTETYGILVIGHGSSMQYNQEFIEKMGNMLSESMPGAIVKVGFMCKNSPTVEEALDGFSGCGVDGIVVLPMFLEKGVHVMEDIPGILGLKDGRKYGMYKGMKVIYADPLGADELLVRLACKRISQACVPYGLTMGTN